MIKKSKQSTLFLKYSKKFVLGFSLSVMLFYFMHPLQVYGEVISKDNLIANSQQKQISGKVTDESGNTLAGVSVLIKGTMLGTLTDATGKFELSNVPQNATLVFSFIGMITEEIPSNGQMLNDVVLKESSVGLEEVVVIGYGTRSKAMLTTAISSINSEKLATIPFPNLSEAMVGQIAGVRFQQAGDAPGSAPYIRIRGNGSLTSSNGPLFVIDGYPTDDASLYNTILPSDIESIEILKDAASASIYGSRAGNGVIMITTKSGISGKTKFTFDATSGFKEVSKKYKMAGAELFVEVDKEARANLGLSIPDILNEPDRWSHTDWQDVIFHKAPFNNYELGASGGNDKMNFNISFGYLDDQGIVLNSWEKRYSMRASFNANLSKKLKVGVNIAPTYTIDRMQETSGTTSSATGGVLADACSMIPIFPVWQTNGDFYMPPQIPEMQAAFPDQYSNPLVKLDANLNYNYYLRQTGSAFVSYEPIKGLVLKSTLNTGITNSKNELYVQAFLARGNGGTGNISTPNLAQINASRSNVTNINWYWSNTVSYDFKISDKHVFNALLGYDLSTQLNYSLTISPRTDVNNPVDFISTTIHNIAGATLTTGTTSKNEYMLDAYFTRLNYSYDGKYLFSASIRRDRSSRFGPDNRAGIFPSVSAAWNITDESFMDNIKKYLSLAKLRISYGETGNDRISGSYPWLSTLSMNFYNFGTTDARVITYGPSGFSNPDLGWEKNKQFDAGTDIGFLRNRINLNFDVYQRNSNTIISAAIPLINGKATTSMQNIGTVSNKGLEITLNSKNFVGTFKWQTDFNISFNRNKITALNGGATLFATTTESPYDAAYVRNYLGRPMGDIYAYKITGTFNTAQDLIDYPKFGTEGLGDLRFQDVSGPNGVPDGIINPYDLQRIGNAQPDFVYSIVNSFQYRNFDLNIILDGSHGGWIIDQFMRAISLNRHLENELLSVAENRWQSADNPGDGRTQRAGSNNLSADINSNDRFVFKTDFLRIRNISLGYTPPEPVLQKIGVQSIRFSLTVTNLYTFTKYPGLNPEGDTNGDNAISNGYDAGSYPLSREFLIGISLGF